MQFNDANQRRAPYKVASLGIAEGEEGIRQTLRLMSSIVKRSKTDPVVLFKARELITGLGQKDYSGEIRALFRYVRDAIRYVKDPTDVQTVTTPDKLMQHGQGNCANKSVLLASLLESIGHPTRFVAVGFENREYVHVYVQTRFGPGWLNLETTENVDEGWGPSGVKHTMVVTN